MSSARLLLKQLTCYSAEKCMMAVTGSSMAFLWMQLGLTPPNGVAPVMHLSEVSIPSVHDRAARERLLGFLFEQSSPEIRAGELDEKNAQVMWKAMQTAVQRPFY